jgi:ABC-type glycerol-3-phosphate transport system permease component
MLYTTTGDLLLPDIVKIPKSLDTNYAAKELYTTAIRNTSGILIIAPLIVVYLFGQKYIVQGIERSGITG